MRLKFYFFNVLFSFFQIFYRVPKKTSQLQSSLKQNKKVGQSTDSTHTVHTVRTHSVRIVRTHSTHSTHSTHTLRTHSTHVRTRAYASGRFQLSGTSQVGRNTACAKLYIIPLFPNPLIPKIQKVNFSIFTKCSLQGGGGGLQLHFMPWARSVVLCPPYLTKLTVSSSSSGKLTVSSSSSNKLTVSSSSSEN